MFSSTLSWEGPEASHGLREPLPGPVVVGRSYWVAVRARSRTPAVVPTYMSSVMR